MRICKWPDVCKSSNCQAQQQGVRGSYAFDYSCADSCDVALDDLVPMSADDEGATGVDRGEQGVAVFEATLEVLEGLMQLVQEPF